jgi:hypothetical protein
MAATAAYGFDLKGVTGGAAAGRAQLKLSLFVLVYGDGDALGAQRWGDEFKVTGSPSARGNRSEIERVSCGMNCPKLMDDV